MSACNTSIYKLFLFTLLILTLFYFLLIKEIGEIELNLLLIKARAKLLQRRWTTKDDSALDLILDIYERKEVLLPYYHINIIHNFET